MNQSSLIRYTQGRCLQLRPDKLMNDDLENGRMEFENQDSNNYSSSHPSLFAFTLMLISCHRKMNRV